MWREGLLPEAFCSPTTPAVNTTTTATTPKPVVVGSALQAAINKVIDKQTAEDKITGVQLAMCQRCNKSE
jgi:UDP-N-acetylmuramyl tripeptide synthase